MDIFENDLTILRCLMKEDEYGFTAASLLDLGALAGLVRFFEAPRDENIDQAPDELVREYDELYNKLRVEWQAEITRDKAHNQERAHRRRSEQSKRAIETRRQRGNLKLK